MAKAKKRKHRRSAAQKAATKRMIAANKRHKRVRHNPGTAAGAAKARAKKRAKARRRLGAPKRTAKRTAKRRAKRGTAARRTKRMLGRISRRRTGKKTRSFKVKGRMLTATTRNKRTGRRRKSWIIAVRSNPSQHAVRAATKKGNAKAKTAETKIKHIAKKSASKARTPAELKATASAVAQGFEGLHGAVSALDKRVSHVEGVQHQHTAKIGELDSHMRNVRGRVVGMLAASRGHKAGALVEGMRRGESKFQKKRERAMVKAAAAEERGWMRHVGGSE